MNGDSQIPDLSGVPDPTNLPQPRSRPAHVQHTEPTQAQSEAEAAAQVAQQLGKPLTGPGAVPQQHMASLEDSLQQSREASSTRRQAAAERHIPRADDDPPEEEFRGHSFMSTEEVTQHISDAMENHPQPQQSSDQGPSMNNPQQQPLPPQHSPYPPPPQQPPVNPERPHQQPPMPQAVANQSPQAQRALQDLFKIGTLTKQVSVAGYTLHIKTLTSDEYQRAWTLASVYPEGTARDVALRQYILAYSMTHINNTPVEVLSTLTEGDVVSKRVSVLARMDSELTRRFFDQGYLVVRQEASQMLEEVQEDATNVANFTQSPQ